VVDLSEFEETSSSLSMSISNAFSGFPFLRDAVSGLPVFTGNSSANVTKMRIPPGFPAETAWSMTLINEKSGVRSNRHSPHRSQISKDL